MIPNKHHGKKARAFQRRWFVSWIDDFGRKKVRFMDDWLQVKRGKHVKIREYVK